MLSQSILSSYHPSHHHPLSLFLLLPVSTKTRGMDGNEMTYATHNQLHTSLQIPCMHVLALLQAKTVLSRSFAFDIFFMSSLRYESHLLPAISILIKNQNVLFLWLNWQVNGEEWFGLSSWLEMILSWDICREGGGLEKLRNLGRRWNVKDAEPPHLLHRTWRFILDINCSLSAAKQFHILKLGCEQMALSSSLE